MKNYRATHDQKVIDAWAAQLSQRKKGISKVQLLLLLVLVALGVLMFFTHNVVVACIFFGVGVAAVGSQLVDRHTLLCPNCHRPPISAMQRGTAEDADFCAHCYYWLKSPYGDRHKV